MGELKDLAEFLGRGLVDRPEDVSVVETVEEGTNLLEMRVHKGDVGKVIGKQGRTARALRVILGTAGAKISKRCDLQIRE